jgi:hypothetical protein
MEQYLPETPSSDISGVRNRNLPGDDGVFRPINLELYHYSFQNPIISVDPAGMSGEREAVPSTFRPLRYIELFSKAPYFGDAGTEAFREGESLSTFRTYYSETRVGVIELLGRMPGIGLADIRSRRIVASEAAALSQTQANALDPDVPIRVRGWIQVNRNTMRIESWNISLIILTIDTSSEAAGSGQGKWESKEATSKHIAERILFSNPELLYSLLKQAGLLDWTASQ